MTAEPPDSDATALLPPGAAPLVIALDGPSGTGKSTVARRLARDLKVRYLDTGAMYRAVTLAVLEAAVDPADADRVPELVRTLNLQIGTDPLRPYVSLADRDVTAAVRSAAVTAAVSAVSAIPAVRALLVAQQRELIREHAPIVVEGRDIGTVVWPTAQPKVFLTASGAERARRRASELGRNGAADVAEVHAELDRRDGLDSRRAASPLTRAQDAVLIDTTDLDVPEVTQQIIRAMSAATGGVPAGGR